jgi:hypothetical protein
MFMANCDGEGVREKGESKGDKRERREEREKMKCTTSMQIKSNHNSAERREAVTEIETVR